MSEKNSKEMDAIEIIYALFDEVKKLNKKVDIVDNNIKLLNNKVSKLNKLISIQDVKKPVTQPTAVAVQGKVPPAQKGKLVIGNIKTFGRIANKEGAAISGVEINVYDVAGQIIKNKKTNKEGYWDVRLPPGDYGVEYKRAGFKAVNLNIKLDESMREFEVGK